ncbi:uncharacterized protein PGTG_08954 [Puccinia graminis f. sp. tritici CRL 75-36-700-3]|uniref:Uncharacterized protein n=1 Tax=Puccinia graminis f. sp. tritici (strain CRL 75-36-700-3 / race SCCL) TaxID=418459 RepID=E3KEQ4_PUCGT|nr:uncharacterized protein PGTG_08954 [Puccinia graminis f. sp. tritici CRL 75-36-700-3]EFP82758.2 hypothetical protein PGTG_08954 [Puccinia graminis f. sp. tritici CRL 75-36-700-3]
MSSHSGIRYGKTVCLILAFSYCAGSNGSFIAATYQNPAHKVVDWSAERTILSPEQHAVHSVAQAVDQTGPRINWGLPSVPEVGSSNLNSKLRAEAQPFKPQTKPSSFPIHPPRSNQLRHFQIRGNSNWNIHHFREALVPHYPVPYQHPSHQQPVHQNPVHQHPAQPYRHPIPPTSFYPPRYETHKSNAPTQIDNAGVDKNYGKMARKYDEIGDNEKHPHYKMLPGDLHPVYSDHTYLREDPFDGDNGKHPDYDLLPDDLHPVYAEHVYLPEDPFEEAMKGNGIHSEIQSQSNLHYPAQKIQATAIASPSKQKANKPNLKTPHSPKLQWKPRSDVSGEDI